MNIFISSTEYGSGKTVIAAGIASVMQSLGYNMGVYKPIQTGAIDKGPYFVSPDLNFVKMLDPYITTHSTYMFKSSALPVIGAEIERIKIKQENIIRDYEILDKQTDALLVEASGGLMTPITDDFFNIQIPLKLKLPVLFVISPTQNTINNYLNELNTAKMANLDVVGVIINKYPTTSQDPNIKAFPTLIEAYTDTKILGIIRNFRGKTVQSNVLFNEILNGINFEDLFRIKIPKLNGF